MKKCIMITGGQITDYNYIYEKIKAHIENSYIICVDGGYKHAKIMNIVPDLVCGDFDSFDENLINENNVIKLPSHKDDTDTLYAMKQIIERKFDKVYLIAASGTRIDHFLGNIQTMYYAHKNNVCAEFINENNVICFLRQGENTFKRESEYKYFSLICYSEKAVISINGAEYPLDKFNMTNKFPIGISNEFNSNEVTVTLDSGEVIFIRSKD